MKTEAVTGLALAISILSGFVSVAAFGIGLFSAMSGPDVTLFPIEGVTFYRLPERQRLGLSLRTEFSNTADADQPDALVEQWLTISVDGAPFACFGQRGDAQLLVNEEGAATSARRNELCDEHRCYRLGPRGMLMLTETPLRRTIRPGEITSADQYFDARAIAPTHACAADFERLGRPAAADLIGDGETTRAVVVEYYVRMLRDGTFRAHCELEVTAAQLRKFEADGWSGFPCNRSDAGRINAPSTQSERS